LYFPQILWLSDNPFSQEPEYEDNVSRLLPQVSKLDNAGEFDDSITFPLVSLISFHKLVNGLDKAMHNYPALTLPLPLPVLCREKNQGKEHVLQAVLLLLGELGKEELSRVQGRIHQLLQ
jgi:hypothetical protein